MKVFYGSNGSTNVCPYGMKTLVFDTETTGLDSRQVYFKDCSEESGMVGREDGRSLSVYFRPENGNPVERVNHITEKEWNGRPTFKDDHFSQGLIRHNLSGCIPGTPDSLRYGPYVLCGQFIHFDLSFLQEQMKHPLTAAEMRMLLVWDTRSVEKALHPEAKSHSLIETAIRRGIVTEDDRRKFHDASFDSSITARVMEQQVEEIDTVFPSLWQDVDIGDYCCIIDSVR